MLNEKELNIHYWKYCPILMRCTHCNQVIEIPSLQDHLTGKCLNFISSGIIDLSLKSYRWENISLFLAECEMKELFRKCQVCSQAVGIEELNSHHTSVQCTCKLIKLLALWL